MEIKTVTYGRLQSEPGTFSNRRIELTAEASPGESYVDILDRLREIVDAELNSVDPARTALKKLRDFVNDDIPF